MTGKLEEVSLIGKRSYRFPGDKIANSEWNIHKKLLNVVMEPYPESDSAFAHAVSTFSEACFLEKKLCILDGQLLLTNCLACSLTSIAQEALQAGLETVKKVRDCVKYVKTSELIEEKFLALKQQLQLIFDTANLLTSSSVPTTNNFFHEAWKLQLELTCASTSEDKIVTTITKPMIAGFDKYWKSSCLVLAIAVVMDPRFKMKLVEFSFTKLYGDEAETYINIVDEGIHQLFLEYTGDVTGVHGFDVMGWWKLNKSKYPTLSKMAHDILTVPVSTVDPESVFYTGMKEMDHCRCTLRPETVEALCHTPRRGLDGNVSEGGGGGVEAWAVD
ncbi:zinc finger BED domain-containing protein DAYSLEEPER-like protein [Tanacetum coccineum]